MLLKLENCQCGNIIPILSWGGAGVQSHPQLHIKLTKLHRQLLAQQTMKTATHPPKSKSKTGVIYY